MYCCTFIEFSVRYCKPKIYTKCWYMWIYRLVYSSQFWSMKEIIYRRHMSFENIGFKHFTLLINWMIFLARSQRSEICVWNLVVNCITFQNVYLYENKENAFSYFMLNNGNIHHRSQLSDFLVCSFLCKICLPLPRFLYLRTCNFCKCQLI